MSYNHFELTARTVGAALNFKDHFSKIFLVHNGTESETVQTLKSQFPQIEHLVLSKNKGYAGGANFGLTEAFKISPWVFFLTNDCIVTKLNIDLSKQAPGFIAPRIEIRKTFRVDSLGGRFRPESASLGHCRSADEFLRLQEPTSSELPYIPGTSYFIHRSVFEKVGSFQEDLGTYWEDVDLSVRAFKAGFRLGVDEGVVIEHGVGKTCHKHTLYTLYFYQRNRKRISLKFTPPHLQLALWLRLTWGWIRLAVRLVRSGRSADLAWLAKAITERHAPEPGHVQVKRRYPL